VRRYDSDLKDIYLHLKKIYAILEYLDKKISGRKSK